MFLAAKDHWRDSKEQIEPAERRSAEDEVNHEITEIDQGPPASGADDTENEEADRQEDPGANDVEEI
jgi:hypothetical protein